jgi:hypothetical protein
MCLVKDTRVLLLLHYMRHFARRRDRWDLAPYFCVALAYVEENAGDALASPFRNSKSSDRHHYTGSLMDGL